MASPIKIALVHDFLLYPGGAERVLVDIARLFPEAPLYTLLSDQKAIQKIDEAFDGDLSSREVRESFLGRCPSFLKKRHRFLSPFFASAIESLDLRDFDVVISSSGAWSKGVVTRTHTRHIAYLHSPMRFAWDCHEQYWKDHKKKISVLRRMFLSYLRVWDAQASQRPDMVLANSRYTQKRIAKYYRRESHVVYPGVYDPEEPIVVQEEGRKRDTYLLVSRLSASKRVDIAIEVCNKLKLPLRIVGDGPMRSRLEKMAGETITFTGWLSRDAIEKEYHQARAFLFPSRDDFGIAPVEAMLHGVPVIASGGASAPEIVSETETGIVCDGQSVDSMADGIRRFLQVSSWDHSEIQRKAQVFSRETFEKELKKVVYE